MKNQLQKKLTENRDSLSQLEIRIQELNTQLGDYLAGRKEDYFASTPLAVYYHEARSAEEEIQAKDDLLEHLDQLGQDLEEVKKERDLAESQQKSLEKTHHRVYPLIGEAAWVLFRKNPDQFPAEKHLFQELLNFNEEYLKLSREITELSEEKGNLFQSMVKGGKRLILQGQRALLDRKLSKMFFSLGKALSATDLLDIFMEDIQQKAGSDIIKDKGKAKTLASQIKSLDERESQILDTIQQHTGSQSLQEKTSDVEQEKDKAHEKRVGALQHLGQSFYHMEDRPIPSSKPLESKIQPLDELMKERGIFMEAQKGIRAALDHVHMEKELEELKKHEKDIVQKMASLEQERSAIGVQQNDLVNKMKELAQMAGEHLENR